MAHVLVINSSLSCDKGQSTQLSQQFLASLPAGFTTETLDLVQDSFTHLTMTEIGAWMTPESDRSDEQKALAALSDDAIAQIQKADAIEKISEQVIKNNNMRLNAAKLVAEYRGLKNADSIEIPQNLIG